MCLPAVTVVADRVFVAAGESGTGCCVISMVDALALGECFAGTSVSGGPVVI